MNERLAAMEAIVKEERNYHRGEQVPILLVTTKSYLIRQLHSSAILGKAMSN